MQAFSIIFIIEHLKIEFCLQDVYFGRSSILFRVGSDRSQLESESATLLRIQGIPRRPELLVFPFSPEPRSLKQRGSTDPFIKYYFFHWYQSLYDFVPIVCGSLSW